ncbi:MAG TPA: MotA/TolQ/ExbB proton channel family protein [Bryobacteraceae bacterium]|nr:MotA/TolQ/ExbB proton channel family protein [Bryobacteraceae bacterium]
MTPATLLKDATYRQPYWVLPDRRITMFSAVALGVLFIAMLTAILTPGSRAATLVLDRTSPHFPYPFTIQNFEHIFFFLALGELFVRWRVGAREIGFSKIGLLPEDQHTVLQAQDLSLLRHRVANQFDGEHGFLPSLIDTCILQFQSGRSVDQTVAVMDSSLELIEHRVDMRYGLVRYIAWLVPTLGFIGTVIGLGSSLASVPKDSSQINMSEIAHNLAVGFDCTMIALAESAIVVYILQVVNEQEEKAVNLAGTYTLRNLINRLYAG